MGAHVSMVRVSGGPDAARVAIVSDASSVHFIAAAHARGGPSSRSFACNAFADAVVHLGLTAAHQIDVKDAVARLLTGVAQCNSARVALGL